MAVSGSLSLAVRALEDVLWAKQEVKRFAEALAFSVQDLARIEVTATELASNMVKHAHGGSLVVQRVARDGQAGLRMVAQDKGPGIADLTVVLKAGYSTAGSLGVGLSAVQEYMDKFEMTSELGVGTRVEVEKWVR
jgi:serine/threonine-protein kinase RsbT